MHGIDQLVAVMKNRLKRIQYQPELIDAFLADNGLKRDAPLPCVSQQICGWQLLVFVALVPVGCLDMAGCQ